MPIPKERAGCSHMNNRSEESYNVEINEE